MSINVCNDRSMASITSLPSGVSGSSLVLISTVTASSSSTVEFTSGIDSTYKEYIIKFIDVHPATDGATLELEASTNGGSSYGVTKTTTYFTAYHGEDGSSAALTYYTSQDLGQSTSSQNITHYQGNDNDQSGSGTLQIFDPSSTTFIKHFMTSHSESTLHDYNVSNHVAGYFNTTSAINAIKFSMSSGNIDSGTFKLYGVV